MATKHYSEKSILYKGIIIEDGNNKGEFQILPEGVFTRNIIAEIPVIRSAENTIQNILGFAKVYLDKGILKADLTLKEDVIEAWPSMAGKIIKHSDKIVTQFHLQEIDIFYAPIKGIKSLCEQITEIHLKSGTVIKTAIKKP